MKRWHNYETKSSRNLFNWRYSNRKLLLWASKDIAKRWSNHASFLKNSEYKYKFVILVGLVFDFFNDNEKRKKRKVTLEYMPNGFKNEQGDK